MEISLFLLCKRKCCGVRMELELEILSQNQKKGISCRECIQLFKVHFRLDARTHEGAADAATLEGIFLTSRGPLEGICLTSFPQDSAIFSRL